MRTLVLLLAVAVAAPSTARAVDLAAVRGDLGVGINRFGGLSVRIGITPELWWKGLGIGLRASVDVDLEAGVLSDELDMHRLEPHLLGSLEHNLLVGGGLGVAWVKHYSAFSIDFSNSPDPESAWEPALTGSLLFGYLGPRKRLGTYLRLDGTSKGTLAGTLAFTGGPSWQLSKRSPDQAGSP